MKLRQFFENVYEEAPESFDGGLKTIGISYGRFNPPHKGHKHVWEGCAKNPIWYVGTNENTGGSDEKNPLPYDVKLQLMEAIYPKIAGHVIPEQDLFVMASRIFEKYGSNVHLKVYTDEQWLYAGLVKYNGLKDQKHGHYNFVQIDHVPTQRLASATDLRKAVRTGDKKRFYHDMGIKPSVTIEVNGQEMPAFEVVAHYLNQFPEKVKEVSTQDAPAKKSWADYGMPEQEPKKEKEHVYHGWKEFEDEEKHHHAEKKHERNLVKEANQQVRAMRAKLAEAKPKERQVPKHFDDAHMGSTIFRDVGGYDRTYHLNRTMMAAAMADGKSKKPVDMDAESWVEKYNVVFPYTDMEHAMMLQAFATIPTDSKELAKRGKSEEPKDTNKVSPVAKPKRNQYGI